MIEEINKENAELKAQHKSSDETPTSADVVHFEEKKNDYRSLVQIRMPSLMLQHKKSNSISIKKDSTSPRVASGYESPNSSTMFGFEESQKRSSSPTSAETGKSSNETSSENSASSNFNRHKISDESLPPTEGSTVIPVRTGSVDSPAASSTTVGPTVSQLFSTTPNSINTNNWFATTTERFMNKNGFKPQLSKLVKAIDEALLLMPLGAAEIDLSSYTQSIDTLIRIVDETWRVAKIGRDLVLGICDHFRRSGHFDAIVQMVLTDKIPTLRTRMCELLDAYMSVANREHLMKMGVAKEFVKTIIRYGCDEREHRRQIALSLLEPFLKRGPDMCRSMAEWGCLDLLLCTCRINLRVETLLSAAVDMTTMALLGGGEIRRLMVDLNVPTWLFVLVNHNDVRLRFYGCLTLCILASERDLAERVEKSDDLLVVDSLLRTYQPEYVAKLDTKFRLGRSTEWLAALLPLFSSTRRQIQGMAAFQLAMEASLRKGSRNIEVFEEIGAVSLLRSIASKPSDSMAVIFASKVLETVGEVLPRRLGQMVPSWTVDDVQFWVTQIGFGDVAHNFAKFRVDGDLLLRTTEECLIKEIGLLSKYERMRFERELMSLKCTADYSCLDHTRLDLWLMQVDRSFCVYTYQMLQAGVDRKSITVLNDELLKLECGVENGIHRQKLLKAIQDIQTDDFDGSSTNQRQIDVFICYRRSTGSQLASLLKVHLQLRGYKVFLDVDRLYAGQIDTSLLVNIRAAKHFVLVLSGHSLDRCIDDVDMKDWVHIEISTALAAGRNIIPVQDRSFEWPDEELLPVDIRPIKQFNVVNWVHEYQEACVEKLEKFLSGETTPISSIVDPTLLQSMVSVPMTPLVADPTVFPLMTTSTPRLIRASGVPKMALDPTMIKSSPRNRSYSLGFTDKLRRSTQ